MIIRESKHFLGSSSLKKKVVAVENFYHYFPSQQICQPRKKLLARLLKRQSARQPKKLLSERLQKKQQSARQPKKLLSASLRKRPLARQLKKLLSVKPLKRRLPVEKSSQRGGGSPPSRQIHRIIALLERFCFIFSMYRIY